VCCNWLQHLLLPSGCLVCSAVQLPALTMLAAASYVLEVAAALCAQAVIIMVLHDMWVAAVHGYHACVECGCSNGQVGCAADQMSDPCTLLQCRGCCRHCKVYRMNTLPDTISRHPGYKPLGMAWQLPFVAAVWLACSCDMPWPSEGCDTAWCWPSHHLHNPNSCNVIQNVLQQGQLHWGPQS
jgi:hypothetical protein